MPTLLEAKLAALRHLLPVDEDGVDAFLEQVAEIVDLGDAAAIPELLMIMDDNCSLSGVMDAVSRNLEEFPDEVYVPHLLGSLPALCEKSPFWCENEVRKYLWDPRVREVLIAHAVRSGAETTRVLGTVLRTIQTKTPRLADASAQVLVALGL